MSSENFRRQLRSESEGWWREGLIDAKVYEHLAERYDFSSIEKHSSNRFITILIGLGGILLGLGAITLIAANWQSWSRNLQMGVMFSAFVAVNSAGFYCWRRPIDRPGMQKLGLGLLLAGALIMGANLGLLSQMFHQSGSPSVLYLVWGLGVLVMAYGLKLTPLGVLAWLLILASHREAFFGGWWGGGMANAGLIGLIQIWLPLLITPLFLPLAHWCRSRVLYGLWGAGMMTMLLTAGGALVKWNAVSLTCVFLLPPALLWVYHARFWQWPVNQVAALKADRPVQQRFGADAVPSDIFQPIGQSLAIWFLSISAYGYSLRWAWQNSGAFFTEEASMAKSFSLSLVVLWAIALYGVWQCILRQRQQPEPKSLWMKTPVFGILLALTGLCVWNQYRVAPSSMWGLVVMNIVLFFIGFAMLHDGMLLGIRHRFWGGMGIVVIGLMTRMFEYDTDLLLKAVVLAGCGIAIIAAGLWFEKQTKASPTKAVRASS